MIDSVNFNCVISKIIYLFAGEKLDYDWINLIRAGHCSVQNLYLRERFIVPQNTAPYTCLKWKYSLIAVQQLDY